MARKPTKRGKRTPRTPKKAPQPKKRPGKAREWDVAFLSALAETGIVRYACEAAGVGKTAVYARRDVDPDFKAAMAAAQDDGADELEKLARDRARGGSDTLLIFLLKAARPEKYRENVKVEHAGGVTVEVVEELIDADPGPQDGQTPPGATRVPP